MLIAGMLAGLLIVGLFLSMISSSPKPEREGESDTRA